MSNKKDHKTDELESVEHVLSTSEAFIEKYQKQIIFSVATIVLVVLAILAFRNFYIQPREIAAETEMGKAQSFFATNYTNLPNCENYFFTLADLADWADYFLE